MNTPAGDARCPRCGEAFHCGAHDTTPCACGSVDLSSETLQQLRERYATCLCLGCLRELAHAASGALHTDVKKPAPSS